MGTMEKGMVLESVQVLEPVLVEVLGELELVLESVQVLEPVLV